MSTYEDQFSEHPVHEALAQLLASVNQKFKFELDQDMVDHLDRLQQVCAYITSQLDRASPVLNSAARLNAVKKGLDPAQNEVNQFLTNSSTAHLVNACNQIDTSVNAASLLVLLHDAARNVTAKDAVGFKKLAESVINDIKASAKSVGSDADDIASQLKSLKESLDATSLNVDSLNKEAANKLEDIETRFGSSEKKRQESFTAVEENLKKRAEEHRSEVKDSSAQLLADLEQQKADAERIVKLVGNIGLTGNFKGAGTEERRSANLFRWIAMGSFGLMVALVVLTAFKGMQSGFDPWIAFFRLTAAAILAVPATYAARESAKHRKMEILHRRAELELSSIDAYLDGLPPEKRAEIKEALSSKFFGQTYMHDEKAQSVSSSALLKELRGVIEKLFDKLK